jgi:hypothetical protein
MPKLPKILNNHCPAPHMGDIPVASPNPAETIQSEPEIVNALRARFRDADTLITGTGRTGCRPGQRMYGSGQ